MKRFMSAAVAVILCLNIASVSAVSEDVAQAVLVSETVEYSSDGNGYYTYVKALEGISPAKSDIVLSAANGNLPIVTDEDGTVYTAVSEGGEVLDFSFNVPETAYYETVIKYRTTSNSINDIGITLAFDGTVPCEEYSNIMLKRLWINDGDVRTFGNGNQVAPAQKELYAFSDYRVYDSAGVVSEPMKVLLIAGQHTVSLSVNSADVQIADITLAVPEKTVAYGDLGVSVVETDATNIVIQGEDAVLKTSKSLIPKCDNSDVELTPSDPSLDVVNYIGSSNWGVVGDTITWNFTVEKSGYYKLGYHFRQSYVLGGYSYRSLKIDGVTPFAEAKSIPFEYDAKWQYDVFSDAEGEPYWFYLEEGEHTLSLTVTMGVLGELNSRLDTAVLTLGELYRKIVMITGETPDANRDYNLFGQIPNFKEDLTALSTELTEIADSLSVIYDTKSNSQISAIRNMVSTIERILAHPYQATDYKSDFYSNYGSLGTILYEMRKLPLDIDEMQFVPAGGEYEKKNDGFFDGIVFSLKRFVASFIEDYNSISETSDDGKQITIWLNWGRDQVQVLNNLISNSFVPESGISVNLKIVNASIVQSLLSDSGPDLYLRLSRSYPVDYALRGALYDLKNFDDFEEVTKRFMPTATVPYEFNGGCYALPDTQSFYMLFYRKDILSEQGIEVPKTWDEFIKAISTLARKNMQVGIPHTEITSVSTTDGGIGSLSLYPTMLLQFGGDLYNDRLTQTNLTSTVAVRSFEYWTDLYTKYAVPVTYNFYNRFRSGEMPLAIQPYTQYATISAAAPEIKKLWGMAPIAGFENEDGSINNVETGGGTGSVILNNSKHKDEAWEFLKWWTDTETQVSYANELESILGTAERQPTANVEALKRMSWDKSDIEMLIEQWSMVEELPETPGGYYVSRCVEQAYWSVVNSATNPKSTLLKWAKLADLEIERKRSEYELDQ